MFSALYSLNLLSVYFEISSPSIFILPSVGVSIPPIRFSSVDFPAPEGPRITTNSPLSSSKSMFFSALNSLSPIL
jgi:hypothetical protein